MSENEQPKQEFLGPTYKYYKMVKSPDQLGMSSDGTLKAFAKDFDGLINYVTLLATGTSTASVTGKPLGNKFFYNTGGQCVPKDKQAKEGEEPETVDRFIYVNNVPTGNIPFISAGLGGNFKDLRGLIPGTMSQLNVFGEVSLMNAFTESSVPECQNVTLETIDVDNKKGWDTHYIATMDLRNMDPCTFTHNNNKINPVTDVKCKEFYSNISSNASIVSEPIHINLIEQLFFFGLCLVGLYILHRLQTKSSTFGKG
jgi:hypothetical protein